MFRSHCLNNCGRPRRWVSSPRVQSSPWLSALQRQKPELGEGKRGFGWTPRLASHSQGCCSKQNHARGGELVPRSVASLLSCEFTDSQKKTGKLPDLSRSEAWRAGTKRQTSLLAATLQLRLRIAVLPDDPFWKQRPLTRALRGSRWWVICLLWFLWASILVSKVLLLASTSLCKPRPPARWGEGGPWLSLASLSVEQLLWEKSPSFQCLMMLRCSWLFGLWASLSCLSGSCSFSSIKSTPVCSH